MLNALVEGHELVSVFLDPRDWTGLQIEEHHARRGGTRMIRCIGCGSPMHLRRLPVPYLTQTFVHDRGMPADCPLASTEGESFAHQDLKAKVLRAVGTTKGWMAAPEVILGPDVRVDVLATHVDKAQSMRSGFEIQLSSTTSADVVDRQEKRLKYLHSSTWIVQKAANWNVEVPCCQVDGDEQVVGGVVRWSGGIGGAYTPVDMTLRHFVRLVLRDRVALEPGIGLIDLTGESRPTEMAATATTRVGGEYASTVCTRPPIGLPPRDLRGLTPKVEGIIRELDRMYVEHPDRWPSDSDRARRFGTDRDPLS